MLQDSGPRMLIAVLWATLVTVLEKEFDLPVMDRPVTHVCCFGMPAQSGVCGRGVGHISACRGGAATRADVTDPHPVVFTPDSL